MVNISVQTTPETGGIGLIGAGAVGSLLAASLLAAGRSFRWVVRNHDRRDQLGYLNIRTDEETRQLPMDNASLIHTATELHDLDWLLLAVKAQHVGPLLAHLGESPRRGVLVVANGLQQGPHLLGLLYGGARLLEDGTVQVGSGKQLEIGALGFDDHEDLAQSAAGLFDPQILSCHVSPCIELRMWHKLALNCVVNPMTALQDCLNGQLLETTAPDDFLRIIEEVSAVGIASLGLTTRNTPGICRSEIAHALAPQRLYSDCLALIRSTARNSSSMREDILHRRETEIEALNLAIVRAGESLGLPCPSNRALSQQIQHLANNRH